MQAPLIVDLQNIFHQKYRTRQSKFIVFFLRYINTYSEPNVAQTTSIIFIQDDTKKLDTYNSHGLQFCFAIHILKLRDTSTMLLHVYI